MHKISRTSYQKVLPLFEQTGTDFPLIQAVINLQQQGTLYVDNESNPSVCMVFTKFGFAFLFGDENNQIFNHFLARLIFEESQLELTYLLWYKPPLIWQKHLNTLPQKFVRNRQRIRFVLDSNYLAKPEEWHKMPSTYQLRKLNKQILATGLKPELDLPLRFWGSVDDFLENGFGFCITKNGQVIGICYSAGVAANKAEVDIAVLSDYQGFGLGTTLGAEFVAYCLKNDIEPTWDCFVYNQPSINLAKRLGFVEKFRYPFYSISRPLQNI